MAKIQFEAPVRKILEINGKEYPIATRTGALEKRIIAEHDTKLGKMTEYERYHILIDLLLGKGTFDELFPKGEDDSLDMMAEVAYVAQHEFNARKRTIERKRIEDDMSNIGMDKMLSAMQSFNKQTNQLMNNAAAANNMKKGKK